MSSTTGPADDESALAARPTADPWPHEHGEHPGGLSVPEGYGRPSEHEHHAHLLGDPEVVDEARQRRVRAIAWLAVVALIAIAVAALLANQPW